MGGLREHQPALGFWDGPALLIGDLNPSVHSHLHLSDGVLIGGAMRVATWKFGDFRDESVILFTPPYYDFVLTSHVAPARSGL